MHGRRGQTHRAGASTSNDSETVISPAAPALGAVLEELLQAIRQITPVTPLLPQVGAFARLYKEFTDLGGITFDGSESFMEVNDWLCLCERIFEKMDVAELQKRELAVHQLRSTAASWWKMTCLGVDEGIIAWDEFKSKFEGRFFPSNPKYDLFSSFVDLKQEEAMTVTEYVNRFDELSVYGEGLINTPLKKNKKFIMGLLPSINEYALAGLHHTFDDVLDIAYGLEGLPAEKDDTSIEEIKRHRQQSKSFRFQPYVGRSQSHGNVQCFACGKMGHYSRQCPEKGSGSRS